MEFAMASLALPVIKPEETWHATRYLIELNVFLETQKITTETDTLTLGEARDMLAGVLRRKQSEFENYEYGRATLEDYINKMRQLTVAGRLYLQTICRIDNSPWVDKPVILACLVTRFVEHRTIVESGRSQYVVVG